MTPLTESTKKVHEERKQSEMRRILPRDVVAHASRQQCPEHVQESKQ